jgi:ATP adenylyltransferase
VVSRDEPDQPGAGADERAVHQDGAGVPDELERLWTPHRMAYIRGQNKPADDEAGEQCPFCRIPTLDDAEALIVHRGELSFVVLNLYPYSPGHLMVCPFRHVADYTDLSRDETLELADFTQRAMRTIRDVSAAHGFNIGMNQGSVAGAGIAAHLHQHVVPRWAGDQNFMPIIGRTRTLPELMSQTRDLLAAAWT